MGASARRTLARLSLSLLLLALLTGLGPAPGTLAQELSERDALCDDAGCLAVYFRRKTFLEAWRSCKEKGGNLATAKLREEADAIAALLSGAALPGQRSRVRVWIGLQRQPRQCSASRPLRGYSWTTGDKDTQYTNWLRDDAPGTCQAPRCVVVGYAGGGVAAHERHDNFKWLDGSCSVPMDGYLCRYAYKGMCPALGPEGGGNALYTTPFGLLTRLLTRLPFGSVATVPCPPGARQEEQSVLCMMREDGAVGWSRDAPLCVDDASPEEEEEEEEEEEDWCARDNGGCEHYCRPAGDAYFCECSDGHALAEDGQSCRPAEEEDPCRGAPCEFECLPLLPDGGYRCACPEGYMLAADERGCADVDECLQSPCEQLCVNAPGTFECRCRAGYRPDEATGECEDVDECAEEGGEGGDDDEGDGGGGPCEHACENTPGSHVCHCNLGYAPVPEDPRRCQDMDECQLPNTCQQMCVNYDGAFDCYCEVGYELMDDHFSCRRVGGGGAGGGDGGGVPSPTAVAAGDGWVTRHPDMGAPWDPMEPVYHWTPDQGQAGWTGEEEEEGEELEEMEEEPLDWLTDPPMVASDVIWVTAAPQERHTFNPAPREDPEEKREVPVWTDPRQEEEEEEAWALAEQPETTPAPTDAVAMPTSATPTPDWYEDEELEEEEEEEEEESTTSPPPLPTTTAVVEGAWNWLPANHGPAWAGPGPAAEPNTPRTEHSDETYDDGVDEVGDEVATATAAATAARDSPTFPPVRVEEVGEEEEEEEEVEEEEVEEEVEGGEVEGGEEDGDELDHAPPPRGAPTPPPPPPREAAGADGNGGQGGSWLLVGLLVPLCIFVVVMVALGIVYCTRCAVQPRNKTATDCYHWISGAHDKQGAADPAGVKVHV